MRDTQKQSERPVFLLDGRTVEFAPGATLLQAALAAGLDIPHLCYHPCLPEPQASCRVCVVEVEGAKTLVAACAHPAQKGLIVRTNTKRVEAARRLALELLLSDHPADCLTCEKAGDCLLQEYAYKLGVRGPAIEGERHRREIDRSNPMFERDYNKCISCGNCVAACCEVEGDYAITMAYRGFDARPAAPFDVTLQESTCTFCGNCIQVCPTGALMEHSRRCAGREWELEKTRTICPYCGCGCALILSVKDGRIVRAAGDEESPVSRGWTCIKGRFGLDFVSSPDRLTRPRIRQPDGRLGEATWEEALRLIADRLTKIKQQHGPDAIGLLSSAKCTNEENYLMQKLARAAIGTNNVDHCARLCHASTVAGLALAFGSGAMTNSIHELEEADCIFIIGSNTTEAHPIVALRIKEAARRGAQILLADPRQIPVSSLASIWLRHRPGTDVALINGMLHVILAEGLENRDFITARTEGVEAVAELVRDFTPEKAAEITGVLAEDIRRAARVYAQAPRAAIVYAMGITQHTTGTDNVLSLANLALLTGQIGRPSTGVNPLRGQNNVQGSCDSGALPTDYPGYQKVADEAARQKFSAAWGVTVPDRPGLTLVEMIHAAAEGKVRAMVIMGENPVVTDPNANLTRKGLEQLDFLVHIDMFINETNQLADVILPACSFAEKAGTFTNTERRLQLLRPALKPLGESRPDWQILCDLATALGHPMSYDSPAAVFDEMARLTPSLAGISHRRLEPYGLQWPCPTPDHPGTPILHRERFTRGLGRFTPVPFRAPAELPDAEYPLVLTTGRLLYQYHSGTMSRRSRGIEWRAPHPVIEINPVDAAGIGCASGDRVRLTSRRGEVTAAAEVTERTAPGVVFLSFHYVEAMANLLTIDALDPVAKIPEFKVCAVRVDRA